MILEISKDKFTTTHIDDNKLITCKNWFIQNEDTWITGNNLGQILGGSNQRIYVNRLRCDGFPIISDLSKGYKLTFNKDEILKSYKDLRLRALRALTACRRMKKFM